MFEARSAQARKAPTFNLSVAEDHNYFVGESGLWVHNCTPCGDLSDVDELAKNYATARARGDVFRWTDFAEEFGIEVSGLNKSARSAIRQRARELELVQRATIDSSGVADFGPWTTDIIKRNSGESVGVSVNMPETTAMKYKSHFDYMGSLFLRPDGYVWDHMGTDGDFRLVKRDVHGVTPHKGHALWKERVD